MDQQALSASRWLAIGRLLRVSLFPTAAADIAAGMVLGAGVWAPGAAPWLLILASLCVYHGGLVLNDWADREVDARTRPDRPLASGALRASFALALALVLLLGGVTLAWLADELLGAALLCVAALACLYDLGSRGPWSGPLLLGACRAGNLATGVLGGVLLSGGRAHQAIVFVAIPVVYGIYVTVVSRLGRLEDAAAGTEPGRRPVRYLTCAALVLVLLPLLPAPFWWDRSPEVGGLVGRLVPYSRHLAVLVALAAAFGLLRSARWTGAWTRERVLACMGMALRRLLFFTAAVALISQSPAGLLVAALILAGVPLSFALRRAFPPS